MKPLIYDYHTGPSLRHFFYQLGGGNREYVDAGFKALACVEFDRRCADIMKARLQRELEEMEL